MFPTILTLSLSSNNWSAHSLTKVTLDDIIALKKKTYTVQLLATHKIFS